MTFLDANDLLLLRLLILCAGRRFGVQGSCKHVIFIVFVVLVVLLLVASSLDRLVFMFIFFFGDLNFNLFGLFVLGRLLRRCCVCLGVSVWLVRLR